MGEREAQNEKNGMKVYVCELLIPFPVPTHRLPVAKCTHMSPGGKMKIYPLETLKRNILDLGTLGSIESRGDMN